MLQGIDPILGPELLSTLRSMGHGDELAIVDGNYPAENHAQRLVRADGLRLVPVLEAVLSVLPLDADVAQPAIRTRNVNAPETLDPIHIEIEVALQKHLSADQIETAHGATFYDRVKQCHTIVATSEQSLFANVILRKGVVSPPTDLQCDSTFSRSRKM